MVSLRRLVAKRVAPSVLAVPPGFDGLLRMLPHRFVAPCSQPWGSRRFQYSLPSSAFLRLLVPCAFPALAPHTLRSVSLYSSRSVSPHSFPSRRCSRFLFPVFVHATSRPFSTLKSVAVHRYCYLCWPDTPLGFVPLQGSPLIRECSLEKLRNSSAEAASFWATSAEADAPWICCHRSASQA